VDGSPQRKVIDGKYELVRELGKGGMGLVYEARHLVTGGRVALKVILAEVLGRDDAQKVVTRFQREARAAACIDSQYVVQVTDSGIDPATANPYIVMEFLAGESLSDRIRRDGPVRPEAVLRMAAQACLGLARAHERGVIHRDIKSANLQLVPRDGGQVLVKLLDFGIAKMRPDAWNGAASQQLTRSDSVLGSPLYMSPEQAVSFRGLDGRSDIWSLGVVMYEALCGRTPHQGSIGALVLAICSKPAPPLREKAPWVSPDIAAIVHKSMALEPMQRFQSALEMHAAISALLPEGPVLHESMLAAMPSIHGELLSAIDPSLETAKRDLSPIPLGNDPTPSPADPAQATAEALTLSGERNRPGQSGRRPIR